MDLSLICFISWTILTYSKFRNKIYIEFKMWAEWKLRCWNTLLLCSFMRAKVNERLTNCLCHQEPRVVCVNTCDRRKQKPYGEKLNMKGTNYSISFETHKRAFWLSNNMLVWNTWSHAFPTLLPFKMSPDRIIWLHRFLFLFQVFNVDMWDYEPKRKLTVV